jgi:hypothetical protein
LGVGYRCVCSCFVVETDEAGATISGSRSAMSVLLPTCRAPISDGAALGQRLQDLWTDVSDQQIRGHAREGGATAGQIMNSGSGGL